MIREYALDPTVAASDSNTLHRIFSEFGGQNGRVISDIPKGWSSAVRRLIEAKGFSVRAKNNCLQELTNLRSTGIVKGDEQPLGENSWLDRALELKQSLSLNAILTSQEQIQRQQFNYLNMLGDSPINWNIEQTKSVARNATALNESISHSLQLSKKFIFVDPYFDPLKDDSRLPFIEYIKTIASGRFLSKKVYIHTCENPHVNLAKRKIRTDIQRGMEECIKPLLPVGFTVELWIWPNDKIHDRFVLTNLVGHAFGHGLNETQYNGAINVNVNRLGPTARAEEFRKFSTKAHSLGDSISVTGE